MKTSESVKEIALALAAAQASVGDISKAKTSNEGSSKFSYDYADLADCLAILRPIFSRAGIAMTQAAGAEGQIVRVVTRLIHTSGEWIEGILTMEAENSSPQKIGSAITYARRYALLALCGVQPKDEDDDGKAARHERRAPVDASRSQAAAEKIKAHQQQRKTKALAELRILWDAQTETDFRGMLAQRLGRTFPENKEIVLKDENELEILEELVVMERNLKEARDEAEKNR